jgi:hypothetical protein
MELVNRFYFAGDFMYSEKPSLLGILYRPTLQFQRLNERPNFGLALVINTLLTAFVTAVMVYVLSNSDPEMLKSIMKEENVPQEIFPLLQNGLTFIVFFTLLIGIPLANLIGAFFCWVFVMIFGGQTTFEKMFAVNVYAGFISVTENMLSAVLSVAIPVFADSPLELLLSFIFMVWHYAVLAIGLRETTSLSSGKAWAIVSIFFLIGLIGLISSIIAVLSA